MRTFVFFLLLSPINHLTTPQIYLLTLGREPVLHRDKRVSSLQSSSGGMNTM